MKAGKDLDGCREDVETQRTYEGALEFFDVSYEVSCA